MESLKAGCSSASKGLFKKSKRLEKIRKGVTDPNEWVQLWFQESDYGKKAKEEARGEEEERIVDERPGGDDHDGQKKDEREKNGNTR